MTRLLALAVCLSGCSLFGGESEIVVDVQLSPEAGVLDVEVTVGGDVVDASTRQPGSYPTATVTVSSKPTTVSCSVASGSAATMGFVRLDLQDGWRYPVTCAVRERDPAEACFGCRGSEAFALDPGLGIPSNQRLWVVWGGDSIDNPPLY